MKRRRFLQICAAGLGAAVPGFANQADWVGRGFGADLRLLLSGDGDRKAVLASLPGLISEIESDFSLYNPASSLSRLNRTGALTVGTRFVRLLDAIDQVHEWTGGIFDPTVQSVWEQWINKRPSAHIGWHHLSRQGDSLSLPPDTALTFNGIAQGFAADAVRDLLAEHGFTRALIDMGEQQCLGGPWRIGLFDPVHGLLGENRVTNSAVATSSPMATLIAGNPHLIHPQGHPALWSTVSIEADRATLADGLSTAAVFLDRDALLQVMQRAKGVHRITTVDHNGNLSTLRA